MKTVMSTDWIEVHDHGSVYLARVFLTDDSSSYMITKSREGRKFFKVDPGLLKHGEIGFFENVMESAKELPIEQAFELKGQRAKP